MVETSEGSMRLSLPETVYPPREDTWLLINSLMGLDNKDGRVLEIGSGSGAVSISMARAGWAVTAIDVNPLAIAATRANILKNGEHGVDCIEGSFDEIPSLREGKFDVIVWNLPYLEVPPGPPALEVIEESSMIDTGSNGWSTELRRYLVDNPAMLSPDGAVILLYRTYPESPSKPEDWVIDGWATRTISSSFIGGEKLEVVGHWRPGLNEEPFRIEEVGSTMDYDFPGKNRIERVFADNQTSGRGRKDARWITDSEGIAATWRIDSMQGLSPGILQIGVGAAVSSAFSMDLKWPNDIVDRKYRKCGGVLCKLRNDGALNVGIGMNRYAQDIPGIETTGWSYSVPPIDKSKGECIADAALASALDAHPIIGGPDAENLRISAWRAVSRVLSMGHEAISGGTAMRVVGIERDGRILLTWRGGNLSIAEVDSITWRVGN